MPPRKERIYGSILDCVGGTPTVRLSRACPGFDVVGKLEYLNPSGSTKDRFAKYFLEEMAKKGKIKPGKTVIAEATTGSTGIAFSLACAVQGYPIQVVMPKGMSNERKKLMHALGAELHYTLGSGVDIAVSLEKLSHLENAGAISPRQFENEMNVESHMRSTGKELIEQCGGKIDAFVASVGTGGTLIGVAKALEKEGIEARIVAVEPETCALLSGGTCLPHEIQGVADGIIPPIIQRHRDMIDDVVTVSDVESIAWTRKLIREEGILGGVSSGANVCASQRIAKRLGTTKRVATILPDTSMKYFSTKLFE
jgi:cysteine synthase A